ncbi:hypothetical protein J6590_021520 [Homalodisca vitripennis]|nr:hypothetical protein J6590_021520 [Homalodisca vitripennis]
MKGVNRADQLISYYPIERKTIRNPLHRRVQNEERDQKNDRKRKRCRVCAKSGLKKRTSYLCSGCPGVGTVTVLCTRVPCSVCAAQKQATNGDVNLKHDFLAGNHF